MALGDPKDFFHFGHLAKKMNRKDCPGSRRDAGLDVSRIDVERLGIDIDEDRRGSESCNSAGCRKKAVRRSYNFIAGTDPNRHEYNEQRVSP